VFVPRGKQFFLIFKYIMFNCLFFWIGLDYKIKNRSNTQNAYLFFSKWSEPYKFSLFLYIFSH
jgi:hypothetical protein